MFFCFQYYTQSGLPGKRLDPNICAVCGNQIIVTNNDDAIIENTCKLDCDHMYPLSVRFCRNTNKNWRGLFKTSNCDMA